MFTGIALTTEKKRLARLADTLEARQKELTIKEDLCDRLTTKLKAAEAAVEKLRGDNAELTLGLEGSTIKIHDLREQLESSTKLLEAERAAGSAQRGEFDKKMSGARKRAKDTEAELSAEIAELQAKLATVTAEAAEAATAAEEAWNKENQRARDLVVETVKLREKSAADRDALKELHESETKKLSAAHAKEMDNAMVPKITTGKMYNKSFGHAGSP